MQELPESESKMIKWTEGVKNFICGYDISRRTGRRRDPGLDVKKAITFINWEGIHFSVVDGMVDDAKKKLKKLHLLKDTFSIPGRELDGVKFTGFYNYATYNLFIDFVFKEGCVYITSLRKTLKEKGDANERWNYTTQLELRDHHIKRAKKNHLKLIQIYQGQ